MEGTMNTKFELAGSEAFAGLSVEPLDDNELRAVVGGIGVVLGVIYLLGAGGVLLTTGVIVGTVWYLVLNADEF
jgi:hypothetical protein